MCLDTKLPKKEKKKGSRIQNLLDLFFSRIFLVTKEGIWANSCLISVLYLNDSYEVYIVL